MRARNLLVFGVVPLLAACVNSAVSLLAPDTIQITTSGAEACGPAGTRQVALRRVAIETINRGYDRFVVLRAEAHRAVVSQSPVIAHVNKRGIVTLTPGHTIVAHSQGMIARLYKDGDPAAARATSARDTLGPQWPQAVKESTRTTCWTG